MKTFLFATLCSVAALAAQDNTVSSPSTLIASDDHAAGTKAPWSPEQATGAPDTPRPGDYPTAWAAGSLDQQEEWLMLEFAEPAALGSVRIYESHNPGAITKVIAFAEDGRAVELASERSGPGGWTSEYRLASGGELLTRRVCLTINEPAVPGYNEIDAVGLKAKDGTLQWAIAATASTYYGAKAAKLRITSAMEPRKWSTGQATGEPNTPLSGDFPTAWAPSTPDGGIEWLRTTFASPMRGKACEIYQTCGAGAIVSVDLLTSSGQPVATLKPADGSADNRPGGIVVLRLPFDSTAEIQQMRINLDTKLVPGWNEIDAVALVDQQDIRHWAVQARASTSFGGEDPVTGGHTLIDRAAGVAETLTTVQSALEDHGHHGPRATRTAVPEASRRKGAPWSPEQATAAPDTPLRGDFATAWAPKNIGAGKEWLRLEFIEPGELKEVRVHDSNLPGAIAGIAALLPDGTEVPLRISEEGNAAPDRSRVLVGHCPEGALLKTQGAVISLDTTHVTDGWPEIDAVEMVARNGHRQWAARARASSSYAENFTGWPQVVQPLERARTLEEANERMELLNQRLRALEERIQQLGRGAAEPALEQPKPGAH